MKNTKKSENLKMLCDKSYVVGIDPCESRMDCVLMDKHKNPISKPFSFSTNHRGFNHVFFNKIAKCLSQEKKFKNVKWDDIKIPRDKIVIAIEHSINFWQNFAYFCISEGFTVVLVNPLTTYHSRPLQDANFSKTDNKDALLIGESACNGNFFEYRPLDKVQQQAKYLSIYRSKITKDLQKEQARLKGILKLRYPEFGSIIDVATQTGRYLLSQFIDADSFSQLNIEEVYAQVKVISRGQFKRSTLEKLKEKAKKSVNIPFESQDIMDDGNWIARSSIKKIESLLKEREELDERLIGCFKDNPHFNSLIAIKGISSYSAAAFLAECGDLNNYTSYKQIEKLAGLNLILKDSGNYSGARRISKIGNKRLRTIIYLICTQLSKYEPGIRIKFLKRQIKKRSYKRNIIALSSTVLRLMMAIVKPNRAYIERASEVKEMTILEFKYTELKKAA